MSSIENNKSSSFGHQRSMHIGNDKNHNNTVVRPHPRVMWTKGGDAAVELALSWCVLTRFLSGGGHRDKGVQEWYKGILRRHRKCWLGSITGGTFQLCFLFYGYCLIHSDDEDGVMSPSSSSELFRPWQVVQMPSPKRIKRKSSPSPQRESQMPHSSSFLLHNPVSKLSPPSNQAMSSPVPLRSFPQLSSLPVIIDPLLSHAAALRGHLPPVMLPPAFSMTPQDPLIPLLDALVPVSEMERVMARRTRPKRFTCPECDSAFSNKGQLKGHVRIHTGERPFICEHEGCDKTFTRNEELTRHRRIHSGARPFPCPLCDKRFGRRDHLKKHVRTHQERQALLPHRHLLQQQHLLQQLHHFQL
ncbi:unnamed protein product, partial [Meganyctiphanes norvegica]